MHKSDSSLLAKQMLFIVWRVKVLERVVDNDGILLLWAVC